MRLSDEVAAELVDIALACCAADADQEPELLVKAWQTIADLPPEMLASVLPGFPPCEQFATMMQVDAYERAAIRLLGSKLGFMSSRSPNGTHLTTVNVPDPEEFTVVADLVALGLLALGKASIMRAAPL